MEKAEAGIAAGKCCGNLSRQQFQTKANLQLFKKSKYFSDSSDSSRGRIGEEGSIQRGVEEEIHILAFHWGKVHFWAQPCNYTSCNVLIFRDLKLPDYLTCYNAVLAILFFKVD